ncbi:MAG TPA: hypothetical protein VK552_16925, partial [Reyranella sp.]|nr:hypothetical protein [Reyranella sp.]
MSMANAGREAPAVGMLLMNNDRPCQKGARTAHPVASQSRDGHVMGTRLMRKRLPGATSGEGEPV